MRGLKLAIVAYSSLVALQVAAFLATNILTLYAQALDRISDVLVSAFLLLSVHWSRKPADKFHMFGHGRAQNVATVILAVVLIFFISAEAFREITSKLIAPIELNEVQNISLALTVTLVGMLIIAVPALDIFRTKKKGAALKAQGVALLQDEVSYIVGFVGITLTAQGYAIADVGASLFIALIIAVGGGYLLKENVQYLLGRAPNQQFFEKLEATAKSVEGVVGVHGLRAEYVGPNMVQASLHLEVRNGTPIEKANRIAHEVERKVGKVVDCDYCIIHVDPERTAIVREEGGEEARL
jgi:cation diffusion facilitator family transporter